MGKSKNKEHVQITSAKITVIGAIVTAAIGVIGTIAVTVISNRPAVIVEQISTPTVSPSSTPSPIIPTLTPIPTASPAPADLLALAKQWDTITSDNFTDESSRQNWYYLTEPQDPITETFNLAFTIDVITNGRVQYAFYNNKNVSIGGRFFARIEAVSENQTGCDYGLTFRTNDINREYYWFFINDDEYKVVSKANGQDDYHQTIIDLNKLPISITIKSLAVIGDGTSYKLYINDLFVNEFIDDRLSGTGAGIGTITCQWLEQGKFVFDNFEVRSP